MRLVGVGLIGTPAVPFSKADGSREKRIVHSVERDHFTVYGPITKQQLASPGRG